jgi:YVTN family beta-propeller protein
VIANGVSNPPAEGVSDQLSVSSSSEAKVEEASLPVGPETSVSSLSVAASSTAAGAEGVTDEASFEVAGGLVADHGTIELKAPAGTVFSCGFPEFECLNAYVIKDVTTSQSGTADKFGQPEADEAEVTVPINVAAGDEVTVTALHVKNPSSPVPSGSFSVRTSSDDATASRPFAIVEAPAAAGSWQAIVPSGASGKEALTPLDLASGEALSSVSTPGSREVTAVAISPDARTAYVLSTAFDRLTPVNLTTSPVSPGTPVSLEGSPPPSNPRTPRAIAITPNGRKAYVSDPANDQVLAVNLSGATPTIEAAIDVGMEPDGIAVAPDGTTAYVADAGSGKLTPIDVETNAPESAIDGVGTHPMQIAITPNGDTAYVTDNGSEDVYPIALPAGTVGSPIALGGGVRPLGIAITPDASEAYTANYGPASAATGSGDTVTPIDLSDDKAQAPLTVGGGPSAIAVAPDGKTVYVLDSNDGTVTPIETAGPTVGVAIAGLETDLRAIAITPDQAPVANFSVASAATGSATDFDASSSTVAVGSITSYEWSFGDGSAPVVTNTPTTSHVYEAAGEYTATVTETDSAGTSTSEVFTGQTALQNGGTSAHASRSVDVPAANGNGPVTQPVVELSTSDIDFGTVGVGESASQALTITNTGNAPLRISSATLTGVGAAAFGHADDRCAGHTVAAGASCEVTVTFASGAAGRFEAQLAYTDNASGSPHTVLLVGSASTIGAVEGTVRDGSKPGSPPLSGQHVTLCPYEQVTFECASATTNKVGVYAFADVQPGPYRMEVFPTEASLFEGAARVQVSAGASTVQNFVLTAATPLNGGVTVVGPFGTSATGVPTVRWQQPFTINVPWHLPDHIEALPASSASSAQERVIFYTAELEASLNSGTGNGGAGATGVAFMTVGYGPDGAANAISPVFAGQAYPAPEEGVSTAAVASASSPARAMSARAATARGSSLAYAATNCGPGIAPNAQGGLTLTWARADGTLVHFDINQLQIEAPGSTGNPFSDIPLNLAVVAGNAAINTIPGVGEYNAAVGVLSGAALLADAENPRDVAASLGQILVSAVLADANDHGALEFATNFASNAEQNAFQQMTAPRAPCKGNPNMPVIGPFGFIYIDPSGQVTDRAGVPLRGAHVLLTRADAAGKQQRVRQNSAIMSPANRRNPDVTDLFGDFGWDVIPGEYQLHVSKPGCRDRAQTPVLAVPPPRLALTIRLGCPAPKRAPSHTTLVVRSGKEGVLLLTARVRTGRDRAMSAGVVEFKSGSRTLASVPLDTITGLAIVAVRSPGAGGRGIVAYYSGNALSAPSRSP